MHSTSEKGEKIVSFQTQTDEENLRKKTKSLFHDCVNDKQIGAFLKKKIVCFYFATFVRKRAFLHFILWKDFLRAIFADISSLTIGQPVQPKMFFYFNLKYSPMETLCTVLYNCYILVTILW